MLSSRSFVVVFLAVLEFSVVSDAFGDARGEFAFRVVAVAGAVEGPVVDHRDRGLHGSHGRALAPPQGRDRAGSRHRDELHRDRCRSGDHQGTCHSDPFSATAVFVTTPQASNIGVFRVSFLVQGGPSGAAPLSADTRGARLRHPRDRPAAAPEATAQEEENVLAGRAGLRDGRVGHCGCVRVRPNGISSTSRRAITPRQGGSRAGKQRSCRKYPLDTA